MKSTVLREISCANHIKRIQEASAKRMDEIKKKQDVFLGGTDIIVPDNHRKLKQSKKSIPKDVQQQSGDHDEASGAMAHSSGVKKTKHKLNSNVNDVAELSESDDKHSSLRQKQALSNKIVQYKRPISNSPASTISRQSPPPLTDVKEPNLKLLNETSFKKNIEYETHKTIGTAKDKGFLFRDNMAMVVPVTLAKQSFTAVTNNSKKIKDPYPNAEIDSSIEKSLHGSTTGFASTSAKLSPKSSKKKKRKKKSKGQMENSQLIQCVSEEFNTPDVEKNLKRNYSEYECDVLKQSFDASEEPEELTLDIQSTNNLFKEKSVVSSRSPLQNTKFIAKDERIAQPKEKINILRTDKMSPKAGVDITKTEPKIALTTAKFQAAEKSVSRSSRTIKLPIETNTKQTRSPKQEWNQFPNKSTIPSALKTKVASGTSNKAAKDKIETKSNVKFEDDITALSDSSKNSAVIEWLDSLPEDILTPVEGFDFTNVTDSLITTDDSLSKITGSFVSSANVKKSLKNPKAGPKWTSVSTIEEDNKHVKQATADDSTRKLNRAILPPETKSDVTQKPLPISETDGKVRFPTTAIEKKPNALRSSKTSFSTCGKSKEAAVKNKNVQIINKTATYEKPGNYRNPASRADASNSSLLQSPGASKTDHSEKEKNKRKKVKKAGLGKKTYVIKK